MTIVAALRFQACPLLIGDILVSGPEPNDFLLDTPTVGPIDNVFPYGSGFVPFDLRQKVCVVSDLCTVAWAGSLIAARIAIEILRDLERRGDLTVSQIIDSLRSEPDCAEENLQLVGWLVAPLANGNVTVQQFGWGAHPFEGPDVGERMLAAGSGINAFMEKLQTPSLLYDIDPKLLLPARILELIARLLEEEHVAVAQSVSLRQYFGAGYEVAAWDGKRFRKIDDFQIFMWRGFWDAGQVRMSTPTLVWRQGYVGDQLCIRTLRMDGRHGRMQVRPIWGGGELEIPLSAVPFELQSGFVCHIFRLHTTPRHHVVFSIGSPEGIKFTCAGETVSVTFEKSYQNGLFLRVGECLRNFPRRARSRAVIPAAFPPPG